MKMRSQSGFTLLEVLLAVGITALIGVGSSQLLSITANTKNELESRANQLRELQRVDLLVSRDLLQIIAREVKDQYGSLQYPVLSSDEYAIAFTRAGLSLPVVLDEKKNQSKRSTLQRVAYAIKDYSSEYCQDAVKQSEEGRCLVRLFWPVLDLTNDSEPKLQVLLDNIENIQFTFSGQLLDLKNPENNIKVMDEDVWPPTFASSDMRADLVQIKVAYSIAMLGEFERVYEVPRYAFAQQ